MINVKLKVLILVMALAIFLNSMAIAYLLIEMTDLHIMYSEFLNSMLPGKDV
tara:strand:+ start:428 stop:583 length:156 start_codon:yes stop_codon:yes gene_type:complete